MPKHDPLLEEEYAPRAADQSRQRSQKTYPAIRPVSKKPAQKATQPIVADPPLGEEAFYWSLHLLKQTLDARVPSTRVRPRRKRG